MVVSHLLYAGKPLDPRYFKYRVISLGLGNQQVLFTPETTCKALEDKERYSPTLNENEVYWPVNGREFGILEM